MIEDFKPFIEFKNDFYIVYKHTYHGNMPVIITKDKEQAEILLKSINNE